MISEFAYACMFASTVILHGWDTLQTTPEDVLANAPKFEEVGADGVTLVVKGELPGGRDTSSLTIMDDPLWTDESVAKYVPVFRNIVAQRSLSKSYLTTWWTPKKRLPWTDDASWRRFAGSLAVASRLAKRGGLAGVLVDGEDYSRSRQFFRLADDPPYAECVRLARKRGRECFSAMFGEYPDMTLFCFWVFTGTGAYRNCEDPADLCRRRSDLWPAFMNGMLDAMPPTVRFVDGDEVAGYEAEAERNEFYRNAAHIFSGLLPLVAPENRAKYRAQLVTGAGLYLDSYTNKKGGTLYKGPLNGTRFNRLAGNYVQALKATDGFVWLYGERNGFIDWEGTGSKRWNRAKTWDDMLPGFNNRVKARTAVDKKKLAVPRRVLTLAPDAENCRNSEGDFIRFKEGRINFIYSHYRKGKGEDWDPSDLRSRTSYDGGMTWSDKSRLFVDGKGKNVMSVSCLRLQNDDIAVFYIERDISAGGTSSDTIMMRRTGDEGLTWKDPVSILPGGLRHGYSVLNNSRVIQLKNGRIVVPLCLHRKGGGKIDWFGKLYCCLSDDNGKTWRLNRQPPFATFGAKGGRIMTQEPGVVELKDGRVLMHVRTNAGRQWFYYSSDSCETWSKGEPGTLHSPLSPATVKRLSNGDLLAVWNDHETYPFFRKLGPRHRYGLRTPLMLAVSKDEGRTWTHRRALEGDMDGCFCYTAAYEVDGNLLLGYCAHSLLMSHVTVVPVDWLYAGTEKGSAMTAASPFAGQKDGPVLEVKGVDGAWTANAGHAAIETWDRGHGLRIMGGKDREVVLTLRKPAHSDGLAIFAERYTVSAPYVFTVEAKTVDGAWKQICPKGNDVPVGKPIRLEFIRLPDRVTAYRFRCTSAAGTLLGMPGDVVTAPDAFFKSRF